MIVQLAKTILTWLVVIVIVTWVLMQLFTDPVGSAHAVSAFFGAIGDAGNAILTFAKAL